MSRNSTDAGMTRPRRSLAIVFAGKKASPETIAHCVTTREGAFLLRACCVAACVAW